MVVTAQIGSLPLNNFKAGPSSFFFVNFGLTYSLDWLLLLAFVYSFHLHPALEKCGLMFLF